MVLTFAVILTTFWHFFYLWDWWWKGTFETCFTCM